MNWIKIIEIFFLSIYNIRYAHELYLASERILFFLSPFPFSCSSFFTSSFLAPFSFCALLFSFSPYSFFITFRSFAFISFYFFHTPSSSMNLPSSLIGTRSFGCFSHLSRLRFYKKRRTVIMSLKSKKKNNNNNNKGTFLFIQVRSRTCSVLPSDV